MSKCQECKIKNTCLFDKRYCKDCYHTLSQQLQYKTCRKCNLTFFEDGLTPNNQYCGNCKEKCCYKCIIL